MRFFVNFSQRRKDWCRYIDPVCRQVIEFCKSGWPTKGNMASELRNFLSVSSELSVQDGFLLKGSRLVIPQLLRSDILARIHAGHQGITKCQERAKQAVWWPCLSTDIQQKVSTCHICIQQREQFPEPLIHPSCRTIPGRRLDLTFSTGRT